MARKTTIAVNTLLDNSGLRAGAQEAEGIMSGLGGKAKVAMAAAGVATAAAFAKGFGDALNQNQLAAKFGEDIVAQSSTIYRDAWGDSLEEVAAAMKETERAFGDVTNLDALTESAFILSEAFDVDVGSAMQDAKELTESFGIDGAEAFDLLAVAMGGTTAEVRDELSSAIREYGGFFEGLGFSAEETLGLLTEFGEGGAMELDKAADALKELTIRGTDMSKASIEAYEAAGLSAEDMAAMLLEGGDAGQEAMQAIAEGLLTIEDPAERANAAIALFGTPLEDLGVAQIPQFLGQVRSMGAGMGDTSGAAAALGDQLSNNLLTRLESVKRKGFGELADLINEHVVPALTVAFDWVEANWPQIQATIEDVTARIGEVVAQYWPQVRDTIVSAVEAVQAVIERVVAVVTYIWERWGEEISEYASEAWANIQQVIGGALDIIQGVFRAFKALFEGDWDELWSVAVTQILSGAKEVILGVLDELWERVKLAAKIAWDVVKTEVSDAVTAIPGLIKQGGFALYRAGWALILRARDGIADAFERAASTVTGFITDLPGMLLAGADKVFDAMLGFGADIAGKIGAGIESAITDIGQAIWDSLPAAVQWGLEYGAGLVGTVSGLVSGSKDSDIEAAREKADAAQTEALLAAAAKNNPFHDGGMVMPNWSTGRVVGPNEALILAEVGETVVPAGGSGGGSGSFIGTLNVLERRTINEELEVAWLLHGGRWN